MGMDCAQGGENRKDRTVKCSREGERDPSVGVLGPTAHPGLPLRVFLGAERCRRL
jgi:hypothetical protein